MAFLFDPSVLRYLIVVTASLHFCQVPAMVYFAPRMLNWKEDISKVSPINQAIIKAMGGGIVLAGIGLGIVVLCSPGELLGPSLLGRSLCLFLGIFWGYRAIVQMVVYPNIFPKDLMGKLSHFGLSLLFSFQAIAYGWVFACSYLQ